MAELGQPAPEADSNAFVTPVVTCFLKTASSAMTTIAVMTLSWP